LGKRLIFTATRLKTGAPYIVSMEYMPGIRKTFVSQDFQSVIKEVAHAIENPVETYYREEHK